MYKRTVLYAGSLLLLFSISAQAQECNTDFLGTKTLYPTPPADVVKVPDGYKPVFINYVGRHGARHLTKLPQTAFIYKLMLKADSASGFTTLGLQLKKMVWTLDKVEKGNVKNISAEGVNELAGIASRLYKNNTAAFASQPKVALTITKEIRTRQSADAFMKGLLPLLKNGAVIEKGINDTTLRFYDLSPAYTEFEEKGAWKKTMADLQDYLSIGEVDRRIVARFFTPDFLKGVSQEQQRVFVNDLFGFATIVYSLQDEVKQAGYTMADVSFQNFLTCGELATLSRIDVAEDYYLKGPGADPNGIQVKIAAPLLADFIATTDEYIASKKISANLRFSHAETVSPFATLLGFNTNNIPGTYFQLISKNWQSGKVIPLSANVQWILYRNANSKYLLRCLLNERDPKIAGLKPVAPNFYAWADVRAFYLKKLKAIGADPKGNMLKYLKMVK